MIKRIKDIPNPIQLYLSSILTSRPKLIENKLPDISIECNNLQINKNHVKKYSEVCGFRGTEVPITYPHMILFPMQMMLMTDKLFPFPLMGLVHLTNKIEQFQNIDNNSKFRATVVFNDKYIKHEKGICFTVIASLLCNDTNTLLWRSESTMLKRGIHVSFADEPMTYDSLLKEDAMKDLTENSRWKLSSDLGRKYASVSGDYNPIHLTSFSAKLLGFDRGAIIHGMWTKARAVAELMPPLSVSIENGMTKRDSKSSLSEVYVEFKTPLFLPSEVVVSSKKMITPTTSEPFAKLFTKGKTNLLFDVCDTSADRIPHLRGYCSWKE
jgi:acyl dehydratase